MVVFVNCPAVYLVSSTGGRKRSNSQSVGLMGGCGRWFEATAGRPTQLTRFYGFCPPLACFHIHVGRHK